MDKNNFTARKIIVYCVGLFLYALGIAITTKSDLGISPISTLPYALSFIMPLSFGATTFIMTVVYILIQVVVYKDKFDKLQYLQIVVGILFSVFIDGGMYIVQALNPTAYIARMICMIVGCFVMSVGIVLSIVPNLIIPPGEGAELAIASVVKKEFANVKMVFEGGIVVLAVIVSLLFLGHLEGIREGTIISVVASGLFVKVLMRMFEKKIEKFCN